MLWRILQSNGGLPSDAVVCFANTGREDEATLRFVERCSTEWGVEIHWLEFRNDEAGFSKVDFQSASRDGEPFEQLIERRSFLPNPVSRFCTSELKIGPMHRMLKALGWYNDKEGWDQMIGIRADEPQRVARIRARGRSTESALETMVLPLADAEVSVREVGDFWEAQPFNLELKTVNGRTLAGNCDLCYLKPARQIVSLIAEKPERAIWWARMESKVQSSGQASGDGARFRKDRPSYAQMLRFATTQGDLFGHGDEPEIVDCFCGD